MKPKEFDICAAILLVLLVLFSSLDQIGTDSIKYSKLSFVTLPCLVDVISTDPRGVFW